MFIAKSFCLDTVSLWTQFNVGQQEVIVIAESRHEFRAVLDAEMQLKPAEWRALSVRIRKGATLSIRFLWFDF